METPPPPETKVSATKSGGLNMTVVVVAVLVCATVLGGLYMMGGDKTRGQVVADNNPGLLSKEEPAPLPKPGIVEKGLAVTGLQKAEGGQASADYYTKYLTEQVVCQMTAGSIRNMAERVDTSPSKPDQFGHQYPSPNVPGVKKALEVAASYYKRSVRNKLTLSSAGIDPAVVSFVEKLAALDQATSEAYERYASTLQSEAKEIDAIGKMRDDLFEKEEASLISGFESKFGIKLQTRKQLREAALKSATDESRQFLDKKSPQELAANLIGNSFINAQSYGRWTVDAGEYVFGRVTDSAVGAGIAVVDLEVQLKGSSSGNPGLVRARIAYVKDPVRALYWAVLVQDLSR